MVLTPQKCSPVRLRCSRAACYHPAQVRYMVWGGRGGGVEEGGRREVGGGGCRRASTLSPPPTRSLAPLVSPSAASPHGVALSRLTHLPVCSAIYLPPSLTSTPHPRHPPRPLSRLAPLTYYSFFFRYHLFSHQAAITLTLTLAAPLFVSRPK